MRSKNICLWGDNMRNTTKISTMYLIFGPFYALGRGQVRLSIIWMVGLFISSAMHNIMHIGNPVLSIMLGMMLASSLTYIAVQREIHAYTVCDRTQWIYPVITFAGYVIIFTLMSNLRY